MRMHLGSLSCVLLLATVSASWASAQSPSPGQPLRVWVFTKPDPSTLHYDEWRVRDNAVIYTKRLLTPQTVLGGYKEEARRALPLEAAEREDDADIIMEVVSVNRVSPPSGDTVETRQPVLELTIRVTADPLPAADLKGRNTLTHGAVLDMLKQFDKWLKDNAVKLQQLRPRDRRRPGSARARS
jgi:hypothetical protein